MLLQVHVETPIEAPGGFRGEERRWLREEFQYGGPKARSLTHRLWQEAEKTAESPQALGGPEGTGWCTRGDPGPEEETTWDLGPEHTSEVEGPVTRRPRYPWGHRRDQGCHLWSMGRVMPKLEVSGSLLWCHLDPLTPASIWGRKKKGPANQEGLKEAQLSPAC